MLCSCYNVLLCLGSGHCCTLMPSFSILLPPYWVNVTSCSNILLVLVQDTVVLSRNPSLTCFRPTEPLLPPVCSNVFLVYFQESYIPILKPACLVTVTSYCSILLVKVQETVVLSCHHSLSSSHSAEPLLPPVVIFSLLGLRSHPSLLCSHSAGSPLPPVVMFSLLRFRRLLNCLAILFYPAATLLGHCYLL